MIVIGPNDELVSPDAARSWADTVGASFVLIPGANHFFWARYVELCAAVGGWLDTVV
jgi:alpha/beta superfamily hydrolase